MSPVPRQGLNPLYLMISVAPGSEPCSGEGASPWAQRGTPIRPGLCFRARTSPLPARPWQHPARGAELLGAPAPSLTVPFQACHGTHHTHNPPGSEAWVPPCPIHRSVRARRGGSAPRQGQKPPTPGASRSPPSPSSPPPPPRGLLLPRRRGFLASLLALEPIWGGEAQPEFPQPAGSLRGRVSASRALPLIAGLPRGSAASAARRRPASPPGTRRRRRRVSPSCRLSVLRTSGLSPCSPVSLPLLPPG